MFKQVVLASLTVILFSENISTKEDPRYQLSIWKLRVYLVFMSSFVQSKRVVVGFYLPNSRLQWYITAKS